MTESVTEARKIGRKVTKTYKYDDGAPLDEFGHTNQLK